MSDNIPTTPHSSGVDLHCSVPDPVNKKREVSPMTRILLVSPSRELLIKDIALSDNEDVKKIGDFIKKTESEYGDIERIIMNRGTLRIMEKGEEILSPVVREKTGENCNEGNSIYHKKDQKPRTAEELSRAARELWDKRTRED